MAHTNRPRLGFSASGWQFVLPSGSSMIAVYPANTAADGVPYDMHPLPESVNRSRLDWGTFRHVCLAWVDQHSIPAGEGVKSGT